MWTCGVLVGLVVCAYGSSASARVGGLASHRRTLRHCASRGSAVLLANRHAEVFMFRSGIYTCMRRGGRPGYLGHVEATPGPSCLAGQDRCGVVFDEALAGTVVAYGESRSEPGGRAPDRIVVRSIFNGRILHGGSLYVATPRLTMIEEAHAIQIVVKPDGAVAWIQEDWFARHGGASPPPVVYDVFAVDGNGFHSLGIDLPAKPTSLSTEGGALSWVEEGRRRSVALD